MKNVEFTKLNCLVEHCDEVFQHFYQELLSRKVFAKHFSGEDQINSLLTRQKENFIASLQDSNEDLIRRYQHVGIVHFRHDIPYEVFQSGTHLLQETFNKKIVSISGDMNLVILNDAMFNFISEAMAKGYLDEFIRSEKADLEKILSMTRNVTFGTERRLLEKHYNWMLDLLVAIENKEFSALDRLMFAHSKDSDTLYTYIEEHLGEIEPTIQVEELNRIRFRIGANTENIFFYLEREAYAEVLSLIINILEIYKLTLVLDNVISSIIARKAENVISEKVKLSETDPLTNVMNRRKFEELLENLLLRAHRNLTPLTIMVLDIDNFKKVNDGYGHQVGDRVLVDIAHLINDSIRKHDHLIRYGGEEFVIISADSELDGARYLADKIRMDVENHMFSDVGHVTVSIGIAELRADDDSRTLLKRADDKLYQAKAGGRNCVCA